MPAHEFCIPQQDKPPLHLRLASGQSIIIIGANGAGKTRLGVHLEAHSGETALRIAAHKSLVLNDNVHLMSLERAKNALHYGHPDGSVEHRAGNRWSSNPTTHLLNDFDALLQSLFAEAASASFEFVQDPITTPLPAPRLLRVKAIWEQLLRHRQLRVTVGTVEVVPKADSGMSPYPASQMSDGERSIFYLIAQCLMAPDGAVIIVDEPEAHVHKAIVCALWDAIEVARPDCSFVYITHELDFAVTRAAFAKYFVRAHQPPDVWDLQELPKNTGLPEDMVAELVGSRRPVLFVEGERSSFDLTIYGALYAEFTVMPAGSCDHVIHCVSSYNASAALHRLDARGLIDADHQTDQDIEYLRERRVHVLPVAELENILLLPDVFPALATAALCGDPEARLATLRREVMKGARKDIDDISARYAARQLDRRMKRLTVQARDLASLERAYEEELESVRPGQLFADAKNALQQALDAEDLPGVLKFYDSNKKGVLPMVAKILGIQPPEFMEKLRRLLGTDDGEVLREKLRSALPTIPSPQAEESSTTPTPA